MATVATLRDRERLIPWVPAGLRQTERCFLYSGEWRAAYSTMEGASHDAWRKARSKPSAGQEILSVVEAFVAGEPWDRFVPPHGHAMRQVFERRRAPNHAVVAMRTPQTRTLGFFMPAGTFVALFCGLSGDWHRDNDKLYDEMIGRASQMVGAFESTDVDIDSEVRELVERLAKP